MYEHGKYGFINEYDIDFNKIKKDIVSIAIDDEETGDDILNKQQNAEEYVDYLLNVIIESKEKLEIIKYFISNFNQIRNDSEIPSHFDMNKNDIDIIKNFVNDIDKIYRSSGLFDTRLKGLINFKSKNDKTLQKEL